MTFLSEDVGAGNLDLRYNVSKNPFLMLQPSKSNSSISGRTKKFNPKDNAPFKPFMPHFGGSSAAFGDLDTCGEGYGDNG
jgi:hypothetical protein